MAEPYGFNQDKSKFALSELSALIETEKQKTGRTVLFSGKASDAVTSSDPEYTSENEFRTFNFPNGLKLGDFDRVVMYITNLRLSGDFSERRHDEEDDDRRISMRHVQIGDIFLRNYGNNNWASLPLNIRGNDDKAISGNAIIELNGCRPLNDETTEDTILTWRVLNEYFIWRATWYDETTAHQRDYNEKAIYTDEDTPRHYHVSNSYPLVPTTDFRDATSISLSMWDDAHVEIIGYSSDTNRDALGAYVEDGVVKGFTINSDVYQYDYNNLANKPDKTIIANNSVTTDKIENHAVTEQKLDTEVTDYFDELEDIRVDADGVTYSTAGDAVRGQITQVKTQYDNIPDYSLFEIGNILYSANSWNYNVGADQTTRVRSKEGAEINLNVGDKIYLTDYANARFYPAWEDSSGNLYNNGAWVTSGEFTVSTAGRYAILLARKTNAVALENKNELLKFLRVKTSAENVNVDIPQSLNVIDNVDTDIETAKSEMFTEPFAVLISGLATQGGHPKFDTAEKTLTIPWDTLVIGNGKYFSIRASGNSATVIDLTTASSSAKLVYFNTTSKEFEVKNFTATANKDRNLLLIASIRLGLAYGINSISMSCPYYLDGKLYGIDTTAQLDFDSITWAFGENVKGVNHRGYNTVAPENTLPAYKLSKKNGFKYVECDVSMTSDRVPVLLHDNTINRTARNADGTTISETINITSITYEQALEYDFGIWKSSAYAGTKIPKFEDFILLCRNLGLHPYIELKSNGGYTEAEIQGLVDIVDKYGMKGKVSWISFGSALLTYVKNYDDSARLGFVVGAISSANITTAQGLKTTNNEVFLDGSSVTNEIAEACAAADIPVEIWTVNSTSGITSLNPYVSGVTSDSLIAAKVLYEANVN